jgi:hypothetical protein
VDAIRFDQHAPRQVLHGARAIPYRVKYSVKSESQFTQGVKSLSLSLSLSLSPSLSLSLPLSHRYYMEPGPDAGPLLTQAVPRRVKWMRFR